MAVSLELSCEFEEQERVQTEREGKWMSLHSLDLPLFRVYPNASRVTVRTLLSVFTTR